MKAAKFTLAQIRGLTANRVWKSACAVFLFCALAAIASPAQTFTTLLDFDISNGSFQRSASGQALVQGLDGNFYGVTGNGGANCTTQGGMGCGQVFKITSTGTLTTLYSFCSGTNCSDGWLPLGGLILGTDGNFYGTTNAGGEGSAGTVFKVTPEGALTTLYSFRDTLVDGAYPYAGLVEAANGNFYGTNPLEGGSNGGGQGTIFGITPQGNLIGVYSFPCLISNCASGAQPYGSLVQASNGDFYGTNREGGANGAGTIFKFSAHNGMLTTLHNFGSKGDGSQPYAGLLLAADGNFYGTTPLGGAHYTAGTIFRMDAAGNETRLYSFCSQPHCTDGSTPEAPLVQGTDGNFYGTTTRSGAHGYGTIFAITPGGTLTTLHSFDVSDGAYPAEALVQGTDGVFYGLTPSGGPGGIFNGNGTVFSLDVGLGPFARTNPTSGKVGTAVVILGNNLTGTTAVSFNGVAATFTIVSATEITATVPAGATTGRVTVAATGGTLTSNVNFRVSP
jgi:uncharacterized repeat protein (TIGR03803 family)